MMRKQPLLDAMSTALPPAWAPPFCTPLPRTPKRGQGGKNAISSKGLPPKERSLCREQPQPKARGSSSSRRRRHQPAQALPLTAQQQQQHQPVTSPALESLLRDGFAVVPLPPGLANASSATEAQGPTASLLGAISAALGLDAPPLPSLLGLKPPWVPLPSAPPSTVASLAPPGEAARVGAEETDGDWGPAAQLASQLLSTRAACAWHPALVAPEPGPLTARQMLPSAAALSILHCAVPAPQNTPAGAPPAAWVFPRSHWVVADWLQACLDRAGAGEGEEAGPASLGWSLPGPTELPHAPPQLVHLGAGEVMLLHPWTLLSSQPLPGAIGSGLPEGLQPHLCTAHFQDQKQEPQHRTSGMQGSALELMWRGWPGRPGAEGSSTGASLEGQATKAAPAGASVPWPPVALDRGELAQLQEEAERAEAGNWAVPTAAASGLPGGSVGRQHGPSPRPCAGPVQGNPAMHLLVEHILARDLLSWTLRLTIQRHLQDQEWREATALLWRAAPLAPTDPVVAFLAGFCLLQTAPGGQRAGRAGRKCWLEDGERFLARAAELEPLWALPPCLLVRALVLMGRGREEEGEQVLESFLAKRLAGDAGEVVLPRLLVRSSAGSPATSPTGGLADVAREHGWSGPVLAVLRAAWHESASCKSSASQVSV